MKIDNPFESGHIKNYVLFYVAVVVIMVLFFLATTLFNEKSEKIEQKTFDTNVTETQEQNLNAVDANKPQTQEKRFKLLDKAY